MWKSKPYIMVYNNHISILIYIPLIFNKKVSTPILLSYSQVICQKFELLIMFNVWIFFIMQKTNKYMYLYIFFKTKLPTFIIYPLFKKRVQVVNTSTGINGLCICFSTRTSCIMYILYFLKETSKYQKKLATCSILHCTLYASINIHAFVLFNI